MCLHFANVDRYDDSHPDKPGITLMLCMPHRTVNHRLTSRCYSGSERRAKRS